MPTSDIFNRELGNSLEIGFLDVHIPLDRRIELINNSKLNQRQIGAVLFADISGFTQLTNIFTSELGPENGAEELTRHLNNIYGPLINRVHEHHGEVIEFAGDSINCWFPEDNGLLAVGAALEMQAFMSHLDEILTPKKLHIQLEIRISIATGMGYRFYVGNDNIQLIEVLAGTMLKDIFGGHKLAKPGEIILSKQISDLLFEQLVVSDWRTHREFGDFAIISGVRKIIDPKPWPQLDHLSVEVAKSWVLPALYNRLISGGQNKYITELRWAVPVFIKFDDIDFENDSDGPKKLNDIVSEVQNALSYYGGHLLQLNLGDKGSYIYAIFGPLMSNENDIVRAISAARQIITSTQLFISPPQIGISAGQMYSGIYGNEHRQFYSVCGKETNIAARLMEMAKPGQILVSMRVKNKAQSDFDFRELTGPIFLKGVSEPTSIFELFQKRSAKYQRNRHIKGKLVGREEEKAVLLTGLRKLQTGKNIVTIVEGEAGMGKSRLIEMVRDKASNEKLVCLFGAGDSIERSTIYFAWRNIFNEIFELDNMPADVSEKKIQVETFLKSRLPKFNTEEFDLQSKLALLTSVIPFDFPDTAQTAALSAQARADATRHLLRDLLTNIYQNSPLLLIIEDGQWLDSASWALLREVVESHSKLYLLLTSRPMAELAPLDYQSLLRAPQTHFIRLKPLRNNDIIKIVNERLAIHSLPASASLFILEKAEGNPFFSEELAYALIESKILTIKNGLCKIEKTVAELAELNFPDTIQELITSRIDRLDTTQQLILKVASAIGRTFAVRTLEKVLPGIKETLGNNLNKLIQGGFISLDNLSSETHYIFKHVIIQQVAYSLLLNVQRRELHRSVAECYEADYAEDLSPYYPILAHHWLKVVEGTFDLTLPLTAWQKAAEYALAVGIKAIRNNANDEAISILSNIIVVLKASPHRSTLAQQELSLQVMLAIPLTLKGGWASSQVGDAYNRAHELCMLIGKTSQLFPTLVGVFTYYLVRGDFEQAKSVAKENLDLAFSTNDPSLIMEAQHDQGAVLFYNGDLLKAKHHFEESKMLYEPENHYPHVFIYGKNAGATAFVHLSIIESILGLPDKSEKSINSGIQLNMKWTHPFSYLWTLSGKSVVLHLYNRLEDMKPVVQQIIKESQEQGFPNWLAQGLTWWGWMQVCEGYAHEGIQNMKKGVEIWQMTGSELLLPYFMYLLADGYFRTKQWNKAANMVEQCIEIAGKGEMWFFPEILHLKGRLHMSGEYFNAQQAEDILSEALRISKEQMAKLYELRLSLSLAQIWVSQGRQEDAIRILTENYNQFSEGLSTPLLTEVKSFLGFLSKNFKFSA